MADEPNNSRTAPAPKAASTPRPRRRKPTPRDVVLIDHLTSLTSSAAAESLAPRELSAEQLMAQTVGLMLQGKLGKDGQAASEDERETKRLEPLRQVCRDGNPFPLAAAQWPELVVKDPTEVKIFTENLQLAADAAITKEMKDAIFATGNPCLRLDWWQHIILAAMVDLSIGELFCVGGTGIGKGASVSMGVNLWYDSDAETRIHLTGRDREHARRNIFGEAVKWRDRMSSPWPGANNTEIIKESERHYVVILNPDVSSPTAGEAFSGAHGQRTRYVYDEASALPVSFIDNARRNAYQIAALANPRQTVGWLREGYKGLPPGQRIGIVPGKLRMRLCMKIGGEDCINVRFKRLKVPVAPRNGLRIDPVLHVGAA